ncbi:MAG: ATP-binding protein, partial [bacterium]
MPAKSAKSAKSDKSDKSDKPAKSAKPSAAHTHAFQTEVQQLLHLIIHSLYSDKEIFLRELISNASDACDRLRFGALTDDALRADHGDGDDATDFGIWIEADDQRNTLTVRDNGIGMSREEVIENIGTIAHSGTRAFIERMTEAQTAEAARDGAFIGQFGVGFYSAFLVAKEVTLLTRRAGAPSAEGVKWTSDGGGEYRVETVERAARGTK